MLEGGPGVRKRPTPGQRNFANAPPPGLTMRANRPAVARGRLGAAGID